MIHQLSTYDPRLPPYKPGDRVRVRSVREWSGQCYPDRPMHCVYHDADGAVLSLAWFSDYDGWVGVWLTVHSLAIPENLPTVRGSDGVLRVFHPDWLEPANASAAASTCTCELASLMTVGCRCGQMAREKAVE